MYVVNVDGVSLDLSNSCTSSKFGSAGGGLKTYKLIPFQLFSNNNILICYLSIRYTLLDLSMNTLHQI